MYVPYSRRFPTKINVSPLDHSGYEWVKKSKPPNMNTTQATTLTQNDTGPVGLVTPSIYWSWKMFTGPTFFH